MSEVPFLVMHTSPVDRLNLMRNNKNRDMKLTIAKDSRQEPNKGWLVLLVKSLDWTAAAASGMFSMSWFLGFLQNIPFLKNILQVSTNDGFNSTSATILVARQGNSQYYVLHNPTLSSKNLWMRDAPWSSMAA